jgi:hypothetical protein
LCLIHIGDYLGISFSLCPLYIFNCHFLIPPFVLLTLNTTSLNKKILVPKPMSTISYINLKLNMSILCPRLHWHYPNR